jgi:[ribosomal protein S5]-alanine N-acetyltransferase
MDLFSVPLQPGRGQEGSSRLRSRSAGVGHDTITPMPGVVIRTPTLADQDEFVARMRASRHLHRPWIFMPDTPERYAAYLAKTADPRAAPYIACRVEDGAIVGFLNLGEIIRGSLKSAFLGYGAVVPFVGRGYMKEGMDLVLREAFTRLGLHRVEANIQPGNTGSIALAKRAGFELEGFSPRYLKVGGRWRDHERWAIRAETWRALRRAGT